MIINIPSYVINLSLLITVIILMAYLIIMTISHRKPFRSEQQRDFLKWMIITITLGVVQFSFRFIGDYQTGLIAQATHYTANILMIIAGIGLSISAYDLYNMKLSFKKPLGRINKNLQMVKKRLKEGNK